MSSQIEVKAERIPWIAVIGLTIIFSLFGSMYVSMLLWAGTSSGGVVGGAT